MAFSDTHEKNVDFLLLRVDLACHVNIKHGQKYFEMSCAVSPLCPLLVVSKRIN